MANWCEGTLKIRGEREDLIRFVNEGIKSVDIFGNELKYRVEIGELYNDTSQSVFLHEEKGHYGYWIKDTKRGFISIPYIEFYGDKRQIVVGSFKQAWDIDSKQLAKASSEYKVDLKIYAFERGMEFNRDIEIIDGQIIKDETITFENYEWECINPEIGG